MLETWRSFDMPAKQIWGGHVLLVVCCVFYLAWWYVAFRPGAAPGGAKSVVLLALAAAAGIAGLVMAILGIRDAPHAVTPALLPGALVLGGGVALYVILLLVTWLGCKRPVTTELVLIVGWAVLELCALNALYGGGRLARGPAIAFCWVVAAAFIISMVCYVLYYKLAAWPGFISGMIPLATEGLTMALVAVLLLCGG